MESKWSSTPTLTQFAQFHKYLLKNSEAQHAVQCMKTKQQHQKEPEAPFPIFLYRVFRSGEWSDARKTRGLPSAGYISHPDSSVTAWATASPLVILSERRRENRQNEWRPETCVERQRFTSFGKTEGSDSGCKSLSINYNVAMQLHLTVFPLV